MQNVKGRWKNYKEVILKCFLRKFGELWSNIDSEQKCIAKYCTEKSKKNLGKHRFLINYFINNILKK